MAGLELLSHVSEYLEQQSQPQAHEEDYDNEGEGEHEGEQGDVLLSEEDMIHGRKALVLNVGLLSWATTLLRSADSIAACCASLVFPLLFIRACIRFFACFRQNTCTAAACV